VKGGESGTRRGDKVEPVEVSGSGPAQEKNDAGSCNIGSGACKSVVCGTTEMEHKWNMHN
jgi:hypothetical protein